MSMYEEETSIYEDRDLSRNKAFGLRLLVSETWKEICFCVIIMEPEQSSTLLWKQSINESQLPTTTKHSGSIM